MLSLFSRFSVSNCSKRHVGPRMHRRLPSNVSCSWMLTMSAPLCVPIRHCSSSSGSHDSYHSSSLSPSLSSSDVADPPSDGCSAAATTTPSTTAAAGTVVASPLVANHTSHHPSSSQGRQQQRRRRDVWSHPSTTTHRADDDSRADQERNHKTTLQDYDSILFSDAFGKHLLKTHKPEPYQPPPPPPLSTSLHVDASSIHESLSEQEMKGRKGEGVHRGDDDEERQQVTTESTVPAVAAEEGTTTTTTVLSGTVYNIFSRRMTSVHSDSIRNLSVVGIGVDAKTRTLKVTDPELLNRVAEQLRQNEISPPKSWISKPQSQHQPMAAPSSLYTQLINIMMATAMKGPPAVTVQRWLTMLYEASEGPRRNFRKHRVPGNVVGSLDEESAGSGGSSSLHPSGEGSTAASEFLAEQQLVPLAFDQLTAEQQKVLAFACEGYSMYLGGGAGTGKTTMLRALKYRMQHELRLRVSVAAMTGIAAVNLGGYTLHHLFGISRDGVVQKKKILTSIDVLIIDEVSMIPRSIFELLDRAFRDANHCEHPFGGVQVILCGDFLQLPSISDQPILSSPVFRRHFAMLKLHEVKRQASDSEFAMQLQKLRRGEVPEDLGKLVMLLDSKALVEQGFVRPPPPPPAAVITQHQPTPPERRVIQHDKKGEEEEVLPSSRKLEQTEEAENKNDDNTNSFSPSSTSSTSSVSQRKAEASSSSSSANDEEQRELMMEESSRAVMLPAPAAVPGSTPRAPSLFIPNAVNLLPTNAEVTAANELQLQRIPGQAVRFPPLVTAPTLSHEGSWTDTIVVSVPMESRATFHVKEFIEMLEQHLFFDGPSSVVVYPSSLLTNERNENDSTPDPNTTLLLGSSTAAATMTSAAANEPSKTNSVYPALRTLSGQYRRDKHQGFSLASSASSKSNTTCSALSCYPLFLDAYAVRVHIPSDLSETDAAELKRRLASLHLSLRQFNGGHHKVLETFPAPNGSGLHMSRDERELQRAARTHPMGAPLDLKIGCRVLARANLSSTIANGTVGVVVGFRECKLINVASHLLYSNRDVYLTQYAMFLEYECSMSVPVLPVVDFGNGIVETIPPAAFQVGGDASTNFYSVSIVTLPITLAYAFTVHKVQGLTLVGRVHLELSNMWPCDHLLYVAMSRVKNPEQLSISSFDPSLVRVASDALIFDDSLPSVEDVVVPMMVVRSNWKRFPIMRRKQGQRKAAADQQHRRSSSLHKRQNNIVSNDATKTSEGNTMEEKQTKVPISNAN